MKIVKVGYGETLNTGNYENQKYYFEAELEDGDEPVSAIEGIKSSIDRHRKQQDEVKDLEKQISGLSMKKMSIQRSIDEMTRSLENLQTRWEQATQFLREHGINPDSYYFEFLPPPEQRDDLEKLEDPGWVFQSSERPNNDLDTSAF